MISFLVSFSGFLVTSPFGLSTQRVYQNVCLDRLQGSDPQMLLSSFLQQHPQYINDLEHSAFSLEPRLASIKKSLIEKGFEAVSMSGSGTAFFCVGNLENRLFPEGRAIQNMQRNSYSWYGI